MTVSQTKNFSIPDSPATIAHNYIEFKLWYYNIFEIKDKKILAGIEQSIRDGKITQEDLYSKKLVFNSLFEGHGQDEFFAVLESIKDQPWFNESRIVFLNNVFGNFDSPIKSVSWTWNMVNHGGFLDYVNSLEINWENLDRNRDFICLMRRRSYLRAKLFNRLRSKYHLDDYYVSYASMINYTEFDKIAGVQIPVLLDGHTFGAQQHSANDPRIFSSIINLVVETSNQEPTGDYCWRSRFASEKTFKCFAWHQIPIWWTVPNFVNDIRSLGFDVFDDLTHGHQYDSETDPDIRMESMLDTLDHVRSQIHFKGIDKFNKEIMPRFKKNYQKLIDFSNRRMSHWPEIINHVRSI